MVLVPKEPTEEMLLAADKNETRIRLTEKDDPSHRSTYKTMITAAQGDKGKIALVVS